jgi:GTP-binding protein EngB required for normal cell division
LISRLLKPTPDILLAYDDLRRRENEALLHLLDTLPRVDGLPPETIEQARDAVFHTDHPFLLTLIGPFGVGKSSIINALLGGDVLATGPVPTTDHVAILRYGDTVEHVTNPDGIETVFHPAPLLKQISLVDTPGLESVFAQHSERTDGFLHRSDWVMLVMLATQALSAGNLKYLETLKQYGKRVLVVINQVDLLDAEQRETVREFVREQYLTHLGTQPEVFLVSARQGLAAHAADPLDEATLQGSGMADLYAYLMESLDDRERLRQKLQTPLQIARNVLSEAQGEVKTQQRALDQYRSVQENIQAQIEAGRAQQRAQVNVLLDEVATTFAESSQRSEDAIRELFQPSRALAQITGGFGELIGINRLARRLGARSRAAAAFEAHEVMEPLTELPQRLTELAPRLEGRDLQDMDDLAVYANKSLEALPAGLKSKVIGEIRPPVTYNREPLRAVRGDLDDILKEAQRVEPERLDRSVRNALIMLAGWELAIVIAIVLLGTLAIDWSNILVPLMLVLGALALMFLGVALVAFQGSRIARQFSARMLEHATTYQATLREAAEAQIDYGVKLREDVVAPFTRLITAQVSLQQELAADLRESETQLAAFAGEIGGLWERESE